MRTTTHALLTLVIIGCAARQMARLQLQGDSHTLRPRSDDAPASSPGKPPILLLAFDGVGRDLLYAELRGGKLPNLARLLGGRAGEFPHAHFDDHLLSTLPSSA